MNYAAMIALAEGIKDNAATLENELKVARGSKLLGGDWDSIHECFKDIENHLVPALHSLLRKD